MKKKFTNVRLISALCALGLSAIVAGCGTSANLAGLSVALNVAQKGQAAAVSFSAGTNTVTVGGSYSQGTNSYGGTATIPTN